MKILWLDLNSSYAHSSLALPAIHAQLHNREDLEWIQISATINDNITRVTNDVYKHRPDIIAATCWLFTHEALMHILVRVKALLPESLIALGGPEFLGDNEMFLRSHPFVNCVFRGEGEENVPQWLTDPYNRTQWEDIEGLCFLDGQNRYHDNGVARVMDFPALVSPQKSKFYNWSKPFVQLETTRGCFNTCAFCVSGGEKPVRNLSIDEIRKRLKAISDHGILQVRVLDRTFNYSNSHALALLDMFTEFPHMQFHLEIHPALLTAPIKAKLEELPKGLLHLEAGIQSLREPVLELCRRKGTLQKSIEGLKYLCSLDNMVTHADLIAGLPLYRLQDMIEDIHSLARIGAGEIQLESLKLLPGTVMRRDAEKLGIRYSQMPPYEVLETNEITSEELEEAMEYSRLLDFYYNTEAWQNITRELMLNDASFLIQFKRYFTELGIINQPLSLERRGLLLYSFCQQHYPDWTIRVSQAWIEAGMSLKKQPAEHVRTKHQHLPEHYTKVWGHYKDNLKWCLLPTNDDGTEGYWYGYETEVQNPKPVFKAVYPNR